MRTGTLIPSLATCAALVLLAAFSSKTVGQESRITDDGGTIVIPAETDTTVVVKPQTPAAAPAPAPAPATPATAAATAEAAAIASELGRMEATADQILANQAKIDEALNILENTVNQARIFSSRSGGGGAAD